MQRVLLVTVSGLLTAAAVFAGSRPVAVSPGDPSKLVLIGDPCPTFNWSHVDGARGYELVVYNLAGQDEGARPELRHEFTGLAFGWTPALGQCLKRGGQYAWSVRAVGRKEFSEWSAPSLFEVASRPSEVQFEQALEVVRRYLATAATIPGERRSRDRVEASRGQQPRESQRTTSPPATVLAVKDPGVEIRDNGIKISGVDVVTTATDQDTLGTITCSENQILEWNDALHRWQCGSDTLQQLDCADGWVAKQYGGSWQCDTDSVEGIERVFGNNVSCGGLSTCEGTVWCPTGKHVVGGGVEVDTPRGGVRMVSSHAPSHTQWQVQMRNNNVSSSRTFRAMAVCVLKPSDGFP